MTFSIHRANRIATAIAALLLLLLVGFYIKLADDVYHASERHARAHQVARALQALEETTRLRFRRIVERIRLEQFDSLEDNLKDSGPVRKAQSAVRSAMAAEIAILRSERERLEETAGIADLDVIVEETDRAMRGLLAAGHAFRGSPRNVSEVRLREAISIAFDGRLQELFREASGKEDIEEAELEAALRESVLLLIALGAATALIWPLLQFLIARRLRTAVLGPIQRLQSALRNVGGQIPASSLPEDGVQEIRDLTRAFNGMTQMLAQLRKAETAARESLESTVVERTRKLESASRALVDANQRRSRFLSDISHELRTPLTLIRGEADIALRRPDADAAALREALARVRELSDQLAILVNDLLFIAREAEGKPKLEYRLCDLAEIVKDALDDTTSFAARQSVVLQAQIPGQPLLLECDRTRIRQLTLILLDNAIRYCESQVDIRVAEGSGTMAVLRVENDGTGLEPGEAAQVFERYSRGRNGRALNPTGSGLGLPLARALVEAHGGNIELSTGPGPRTVIEARVPRHRATS